MLRLIKQTALHASIVFLMVLMLSPPVGAQRPNRDLLNEAFLPVERRALVIGNGDYSLPKAGLINPVNDARAMKPMLEELGFKVDLELNTTRLALEDAIGRFTSSIKDGQVVVVYYSGHGLQMDGENYLVPVDFSIRSGAPLSEAAETTKRRAYSVAEILSGLNKKKLAYKILILDACRNNHFDVGVSGLAKMDLLAGSGTYIAFAAAPGQVALDRLTDDPAGTAGGPDDHHSPFTAALLEALGFVDLTIDDVFNRVRARVRAAVQEAIQKKSQTSITMEEVQLSFSQTSMDTLRLRNSAQVLRVRAAIRAEIARYEEKKTLAEQPSGTLSQQQKEEHEKQLEDIKSRLSEMQQYQQKVEHELRIAREAEAKRLANELATIQDQALAKRLAELRKDDGYRDSADLTTATPQAALSEWRTLGTRIAQIESLWEEAAQKEVAASIENAENALRSRNAVKPVKDPFETTLDFEHRLAEHQEAIKQLEVERDANAASIHGRYATLTTSSTAALREKQAAVEARYYRQPGSPKPAWSHYNADTAELLVTIEATVLSCTVPPLEARLANSQPDRLRVETKYMFTPAGVTPQTNRLRHPGFASANACDTLQRDRFSTELTRDLDRADYVAFRNTATFAVELGAAST